MGEQIFTFVNKYISTLSWHRLSVRWEDIVEILIISFLVYHIMTWIKNTKAWVLMKGILIISVFIFFALIFQMNTILWIAKNSISVLATAAIVVFQPELRRGLEQLGTTNRRALLIDKLLWTEDGWPYVKDYSASSTSDVPVVTIK